MPDSLRTHIESALAQSYPMLFLWVSCTGKYPADKEFLGPVELSPWQGFPLYYFPVRTSSRAPILGLLLKHPEYGMLISIECHFWAKNLKTPHVAARIEFIR
ncbi:sodium/potassium-transporting ATPase subunit beta-2-like [Portunus trituberculatus]|uniref:sodium/potassium-transporting ATPase subunit beta-2-like n=1 Tax=Portunus trituberculatus TaxID=210409 RepID=UPI001E1D18F1|nr:sodium/potassium-transporting ATPase subunit beta-2-like [Portunus trituberculatus]